MSAKRKNVEIYCVHPATYKSFDLAIHLAATAVSRLLLPIVVAGHKFIKQPKSNCQWINLWLSVFSPTTVSPKGRIWWS